MAKIDWSAQVSAEGLLMTVGRVNGAEKYFIAKVPSDSASRPGMWRVGVSGSGLVSNVQGEVKWFATLAGARGWANRQEHWRGART